METLSKTLNSRDYDEICRELRRRPRTWLITGAAGFIGSNLLEELLLLDQQVVGLDNFSTGSEANLADVECLVTRQQWQRFRLIRGDIRSFGTCLKATRGVELVLHQAALGSVPRSVENPADCNENNVSGTVNMLKAASDNRVQRLVYASSSAVYGDHPELPKVEPRLGNPVSPYGVSKLADELYATVFTSLYGLETVGLRYFNVFGPRQNPAGAYAAVIPCWIAAMVRGQTVHINGTGETSRDFCYIRNVVQANLLAALTTNLNAVNQVYNVALNDRTSLNELYHKLYGLLQARGASLTDDGPVYRDFRTGDLMHSFADISKARQLLGYNPAYTLDSGLDIAMEWYLEHLDRVEI